MLFARTELAAIKSSNRLKSHRGFGLRRRNQRDQPLAQRDAYAALLRVSHGVRFEKRPHLQTNRFTNKRRHGVADDAELVRARDRELKPIRKALDARGFSRRERTVLRRVDEHEPILAEMRDDGAARLAVGSGACIGL